MLYDIPVLSVEMDINMWELSKSPIERYMMYSNNIGNLKYIDNGKSRALLSSVVVIITMDFQFKVMRCINKVKTNLEK